MRHETLQDRLYDMIDTNLKTMPARDKNDYQRGLRHGFKSVLAAIHRYEGDHPTSEAYIWIQGTCYYGKAASYDGAAEEAVHQAIWHADLQYQLGLAGETVNFKVVFGLNNGNAITGQTDEPEAWIQIDKKVIRDFTQNRDALSDAEMDIREAIETRKVAHHE